MIAQRRSGLRQLRSADGPMGDEGEGCALAVAGWEDPRRQPSQVGDEMQTGIDGLTSQRDLC